MNIVHVYVCMYMCFKMHGGMIKSLCYISMVYVHDVCINVLPCVHVCIEYLRSFVNMRVRNTITSLACNTSMHACILFFLMFFLLFYIIILLTAYL